MKEFFDMQLHIDYAWRMEQFHFHDCYEMTIVLEGTGEMSVGSQTYAIQRGTVFLLSNGEIHRSQVEDATLYQRYVIKFSEEYISGLSTNQTNLLKMFSLETPCIVLDDDALQPLLDLCAFAMEKNDAFGSDLLRQNAFIELAITLNTLADASQKGEPHHTKQMHRITPIMDYIATHATEDITLDDIATEFFITKQHLCYIFKKNTGLGINQYLNTQRLILACVYLRQGVGVQLAGEQAGFRNNSHFIRTFKKSFGVSPGKYSAGYKDTIFCVEV
ncbi:AraC family transcriptional regulator [Chakrabartyella piscis]|uniref:AraC family transcriptional regulator n=1 Tax=Chakrabartyella piscis TaxID=2918914 RepID=UPI002958DF4B|nr:AraC family transcriptional regulator [Chakrabartyella piscis]